LLEAHSDEQSDGCAPTREGKLLSGESVDLFYEAVAQAERRQRACDSCEETSLSQAPILSVHRVTHGGACWLQTLSCSLRDEKKYPAQATVSAYINGDAQTFFIAGFWTDWKKSGANGQAVVLHGSKGASKVVLIGIDATFRAQSEFTSRILANAIYDSLG